MSKQQLIRALRRALRQAERGEEQGFELTVWMIPLVIMILLIGFATLVRSSQMPAWSAASDCAREAVATMDETLGREQAERAARESLAGSAVNSPYIQVEITGSWTPNSTVTCRVSYGIDISGLGGFSSLTGGNVPMIAEVTLRVEPYKSSWQ